MNEVYSKNTYIRTPDGFPFFLHYVYVWHTMIGQSSKRTACVPKQ